MSLYQRRALRKNSHDDLCRLRCPYCGEQNTAQVDTASADYETIEDCTVCCRPILIRAECEPGEVLSLTIERS